MAEVSAPTVVDGDKTTSIFRIWWDRIEGGFFSMAWCRQWAQAVCPLSEELPAGGHRTNLTPWEARILREKLWNRDGVRLFDHDEQRGLTWLRRYGHSELGIPQDFIDDASHFTFHGDAVFDRWPEWHLHTKRGDEITYHRVPWQAQRYEDPRYKGDWRNITPLPLIGRTL